VTIELNPVDRVTVDAVGEPGLRSFYIQARKGDRLVTLLLEKQQVQLLAASVVEILSRVGKESGEGPPEEAMGLEEPIVPEWRAGRLSIGYEEERDLLLLEAEELLDEDEDEEDEDGEELAGAEPSPPWLSRGWEIGDLPDLTAREDEPDEDEGTNGSGDDSEEDAEDELEGLNDLDALEGLAAGVEQEEGRLERREPGRVRFWATREQMLSLARHGAAVCAQGRPRCQFCGNPIEPEGHQCPAMNGHRKLSDA
jgi:uncharacterized repeat protein (TIGR03847 family)